MFLHFVKSKFKFKSKIVNIYFISKETTKHQSRPGKEIEATTRINKHV